jgi:hypothetical protein
MLQRTALGALAALSVLTLALMVWQTMPASAGFTPTPIPPPDTPVPPPSGPGKEPEDTPTPTPLSILTLTPGLLPIAGAQTDRGPEMIALLLVGTAALIASGMAIYRLKAR